MLEEKITLVIHSCDKFSDLWDAHITLLNRNWADRTVKTLLVTDTQTDKHYENVTILPTGDSKELSERTEAMLAHIDTKFVLVTLDDYFPVFPIDSEKIERVVKIMEKEDLDYVRLYLRPKYKRRDRWTEYSNFYHIDTTRNYSVNLYVGIWKKTFIGKTIHKPPLNAWDYEVSLTKIAHEVGARCAVSLNHEFEILDVVRKGKILNKANRYLKENDLYHGNRPVISRMYEIKLAIRTWGIRMMPRCITNLARKIMTRLGHSYYSQGI